jgi:MFS family permease
LAAFCGYSSPGANERFGIFGRFGRHLISFSQAASGFLSDKTKKRKIFIWLGYLGPVIGRMGYAFSTAWQHLIPFKVFDRLGKMRDATRDAMLAESVGRKTRGRSFGFLEAMDSSGAVCGILISVLLFQFLGFHKLLFLAALPSLASALGFSQMIFGLVALPASFLAGLLWDFFGPFAPFYLSLSLTVVAIILLSFVKENKEEI